MNYLIIISSVLFTNYCFSQAVNNEFIAKDSAAFNGCEFVEYKGGEKQLQKQIAKFCNYPASAEKDSLEGTVYLSFIIDENGQPTDIKVVRGLSEAIDKEAIECVSKLQNWVPSKQNGKNVRSKAVLLLNFHIQKNKQSIF